VTVNNKSRFLNEDLPLEERIKDLLENLTLDEKISLLPTKQAAIPRLGIKEYTVGGEAAHGVAWLGKATVFPQTIGLASTWDTGLMEEIGNVIGDEYRVYYQKSDEKHGLSIWFPTVDMERDPRWGRTEEAYGEDPYLTAAMAGTLVKAVQGNHPFYLRAATTLKHFFANNNEKDRTKCSASINPRSIREYYWEPFRRIITEYGAKCIMTAYNEVNGLPMIVNPWVKSVVKEKWGLEGFVVCDAEDFRQNVNDHKFCRTHAETFALALKNGVDCFTDEPELVINSAREALERGLITEEDIDRAISNIFRMRIRYGQFDKSDKNPYKNIPENVLCCEKHCKVAYKAAQKAIVLLKNENILPLKKEKIKKIAVIGPMGDELYNDWYSGTYPYKVTILDGLKNKLPNAEISFTDGSDLVRIKSVRGMKYIEPDDSGVLRACGAEPSDKSLFSLTDWGWGSFTLKNITNKKYVTCEGRLSAVSDRAFGWFVKELFNLIPKGGNEYTIKTYNGNVAGFSDESSGIIVEKDYLNRSEDDIFILETVKDGISMAKAVAADADIVLVTLGNNPVINGKEEMDRPEISLAPHQEKLLKEVYSVNKNTVLVLISSYPVAINWANENIPAIIYSAHGGQEMGNAIADVLFGDYNPAGRLPMTWYKSSEQLSSIMDYDIIKTKRTYMYFDGEPLYPFGYGLSYSSFEYGNMKLSADVLKKGSELRISLDVTNVSEIAGEEVVQLYISFSESKVKRPKKQLKGFKRICLNPGETQTVEFELKPEEFCFYDVSREIYCVEKCLLTIMAGASSEDIRLQKTIPVDGEVIPERDLTFTTWAENCDYYENIVFDMFENGRSSVKALGKGSWISFHNVLFKREVSCLTVQASAAAPGANVTVRIDSPDGEVIGKFFIPNTCAPSMPEGRLSMEWAHIQCNVARTSGHHDIYFVFDGSANISNFKFT
jgi:beta-glucosidase